jgi:hypothetical protein
MVHVVCEYPQPNPEWEVYPAFNGSMTVFFFVVLAGFLGYAVRLWVRERNPIGLVMLAGGAIAPAIEPWINVVGMVYHPYNQPVMYEIFDRAVPLILLPIYMWWTGGFTVLVWRALERGGGGRELWRLFGVVFLIDAVLETVGVAFHIWYYYGNQPFRFAYFPLWFAIPNALLAVIGGVVLYAVADKLHGWRVLTVVFLPATSIVTAYAITAWPIWSVLNTSAPPVATWASGFATIAMGLLAVWFFCRVFDLAARVRRLDSGAPVPDPAVRS